MYKLILSLLIATGMYAQTTAQTTFDTAYWASQPTVIQLNHSAGTLPSQCVSLANQGYLIDEWIMCWNNDAYWAQVIRQQLGYTWVPSLLQTPIGANPGYASPGTTPQPGQTAYPTTPPTGSISVSTNPTSYQPYTPAPAPPPVQPPFSLGPMISSSLYMLISNTGVTPTLGATITVGAVTGTVVKIGPFAFGLQVTQASIEFHGGSIYYSMPFCDNASNSTSCIVRHGL